MAMRSRSSLLLLLLSHIFVINALPALNTRPSPALIANLTRAGFLTKELGSFPPGPPQQHFLYPIIDTDLALVFRPLGHIASRNETVVKEVLREALYNTLNYRTAAQIPASGYKLQIQDFLLSVSHSVGVRELTWGMWTIYLRGLDDYVQAYPGYDFQFELRKYRGWEIEGYVLGAGFVETRV